MKEIRSPYINERGAVPKIPTDEDLDTVRKILGIESLFILMQEKEHNFENCGDGLSCIHGISAASIGFDEKFNEYLMKMVNEIGRENK